MPRDAGTAAPAPQARRALAVLREPFRCERLSCSLTRAACLRRQRYAGAERPANDRAGHQPSAAWVRLAVTAHERRSQYISCRDCPQGREIAEACRG